MSRNRVYIIFSKWHIQNRSTEAQPIVLNVLENKLEHDAEVDYTEHHYNSIGSVQPEHDRNHRNSFFETKLSFYAHYLWVLNSIIYKNQMILGKISRNMLTHFHLIIFNILVKYNIDRYQYWRII